MIISHIAAATRSCSLRKNFSWRHPPLRKETSPLNIVCCPKGHYFNKDKYDVCPICSSPVLTVLPRIKPETSKKESDSLKIDPRETSKIPSELLEYSDTVEADIDFRDDTSCLDDSTASTITDDSYHSKGDE